LITSSSAVEPSRILGLSLLCLLLPASICEPLDAQQSLGRPSLGLALEGGGALGIAHVGVLKWMKQPHIPIDRIAGTSMGALVGSLAASGRSPEA
jgi:hypothetical protein